MPFSRLGSVVPVPLQYFREKSHTRGQRRMQLGRAGAVGVTACDNAASAGTAGTGGYKYVIELYTIFGHPVDIRGADCRVAITAQVIPAQVICYDQYNIGPGLGITLNPPGNRKCQEGDKKS